MLVAAEFGTGQVLWSLVWFSLFVIWIWCLVAVFSDIFRSDDLSGWGKALWTLFVIVTPYLGVFVYLIGRGRKMSEHATDAYQQQAQFQAYMATTAGGSSVPNSVDELTTLTTMRKEGVISDEEYRRMKGRVTA